MDMGFEPQVREIIGSGCGEYCSVPRQSMMFSATFPREVQRLASSFMTDYVFVTVGRVGAANEDVTQVLMYAEEGKGKLKALERAIVQHAPGEDMLTVIFVETKRGADMLERDLYEARVEARAIHG